MRRPPFAPAGAPLAWILVIVFGVYFLTGPLLRPLVHPYAYSDFVTFYDASRCFASGEDPYDPTHLAAARDPSYGGWVGRYFYPPPFAAVAVRPLAALPFETSRRLWVLVEASAYVAALLLFARRILPWSAPWRAAAAASLGAAYAPVALDLKLGSVSGVLLLLLALFETARQRGNVRRAALALAAAVLLKLTPALLVLFLWARGERRQVAWTLAAGAALVAACLPWTGVHSYVTYATEVLPHLATASFAWFTNQSLDAWFWRGLVVNPDTTPWLASPGLEHALSWIATLAVLVALAVLARRRPESEDAAAWDRACVLVAALLVARVTWEYMVVLALPCFFFWLGAVCDGAVDRRRALLVAAAYAACALPFPYTEAPLRGGIGLLLEAPRTYGLVVLFVVTLGWRRQASGAAARRPTAIT